MFFKKIAIYSDIQLHEIFSYQKKDNYISIAYKLSGNLYLSI